MTRAGFGWSFALMGAILTGCSLLPSSSAAAPTTCGQQFNAVRCQAMTDLAASNLGVTREDVLRLHILPPRTAPGGGPLTLGGAPDIEVLATLADGSTQQTSMHCGGVAEDWNPACQEAPHITVRSVIDGYRDVPEGSTPVPTIAPDASDAAVALHLDRLDIPIDHVGSFKVPIGEVTLPNGILSAARFRLVEAWPAHVTIIDERGVSLTLRSLDADGKAFDNAYVHGWRPGTERAEVVLAFDVFRFDPGATLSISDVDVH